MRTSTKAYPPGIHVPALTWFQAGDAQDIDWNTQLLHLQFLIKSGLHGVVLAGTNGEAAALTLDEKLELVRQTRAISKELGRPDLPITVGCNGGCTRTVIAETKAVADAGADFALVLVPSYFHFAMDKSAIKAFFEEVADQSPIPLVIYNFPNVVAGLDVDSVLLDNLGDHANIASVKLTCGGIAKVARIAAKFGKCDGKSVPGFTALAGQSDWLVPCLSVGGAGCITGIANLYPKTCIAIFDHYMAGEIQEAEDLQLELAKMEIGFGNGGINGTKWVVAKCRGYPMSSCDCRRPYPKFDNQEKQAWVLSKVQLLSDIESRLSQPVNGVHK